MRQAPAAMISLVKSTSPVLLRDGLWDKPGRLGKQHDRLICFVLGVRELLSHVGCGIPVSHPLSAARMIGFCLAQNCWPQRVGPPSSLTSDSPNRPKLLWTLRSGEGVRQHPTSNAAAAKT